LVSRPIFLIGFVFLILVFHGPEYPHSVNIIGAIFFAASGGRLESSSAIEPRVYDLPDPRFPAIKITWLLATSSQILFERKCNFPFLHNLYQ